MAPKTQKHAPLPDNFRLAIQDRVQTKLGLASKAAAKNTVDTVLKSVADMLAEHGTNPSVNFRLHELGIFKVTQTKERARRNPQTGETTMVPAGTKISFRLTKALKDLGK